MSQFLAKGIEVFTIYIVYIHSVLLASYEDEKIKELVQICDYVELKKYIIIELQKISRLYENELPNEIENKSECQLASTILKSLCCKYSE